MSLRITEEEYLQLRGVVVAVHALDKANDQRKSSKYHAKRVTIDGHTFDSKAEAARYSELKIMLAVGKITDLVLQKEFLVAINGHHICKYYADFAYMERGVLVVEDVKGVRTPAYSLKKKLVEALYAIEIREVIKAR